MSEVVCALLWIFQVLLIASIVLSFFPTTPRSTLESIKSALYQVTDPVLAPIRRVMPPIGVGGAGLDLSPMIVFLGISIVQRSLHCRSLL